MRKIRVLIVEDDRSISELLALYLERTHADLIPACFTSKRVESVQGARRALASESFDAIVLDLDLPDGSGLAILEGSKIPVVVYAGNISWHGKEEQACLNKAARVLEKSERVSQVRRAIYEAVQQWQH